MNIILELHTLVDLFDKKEERTKESLIKEHGVLGVCKDDVDSFMFTNKLNRSRAMRNMFYSWRELEGVKLQKATYQWVLEEFNSHIECEIYKINDNWLED